MDELGTRKKPLRIGVMTSMPDGSKLHHEAQKGLDRTVSKLTDMGHHIEESYPTALEKEDRHGLVFQKFTALFSRVVLLELESILGRPVTREDVAFFTWESAEWGTEPANAIDVLGAMASQQAWSVDVLEWWQRGYDLLLTPTTPVPPWINAEHTPPVRDVEAILQDIFDLVTFTTPFNITGQPAISLPLHMTADGLPFGMQFVADMGREDLLIQVAAQLEEAIPWHRRVPPHHA
jgi:amidase